MTDEQFTIILKAINDLRDEVKELRQEVNMIKQEIKEIKQDINNMKQEIKQMKQDIDNMKQDINNMQDRMDRDHKELLRVFECYETTTDNMYQENREKIFELQRQVKIMTT